MVKENIKDEENSDEIKNKVRIFSNKDEKLKFLGNMLSSDSSRAILVLLIEKEMTANQISKETNQALPLVIHHLNKMMQSDVVTISKTENNHKNQPMKYYSAKSAIVIVPEKSVEKAQNSKSLFRSLRGIMKFAVVGIASMTVWLNNKINLNSADDGGFNFGEIVDIPFYLESTFWPLVIIIVGLVIDRIITYKKNKKDSLKIQ